MPAPPINARRTQLLEQAIALCLRFKSLADLDPQKAKVGKRLQQLWSELENFIHPLQNNSLEVEQIPLHVRRCFVRAVSFSTRYSQLGGAVFAGTLRSPTLESYTCDRVPLAWHQPEAIEKLCKQFALPPADGQEIEQSLVKIDRAIEQQKTVIAALIAEFGGINCRQQVLKLFSSLFNLTALPEAAIDCLATPMQLVFALDYQEQQLRDETLWSSLSKSDRQSLREFFTQIGQFSFEQFERFPSFGYLQAAQIHSGLYARLVTVTGYSKSEMIKAIARSISIVPTHKSESFLIHDIWGHFWQLFLTQFDSDYGIMTTANGELKAGLAAYTPEGPVSLRELFILEGTAINLVESKARLFFHGEVQQRLGHLFTHLVGEILADINEFKWLWHNRNHESKLPSSSLFKNLPTKLDLSLLDVDFLFVRVLQPLLSYELSVVQDSWLEQELLADWQRPDPVVRLNLKQAIAQMHSIFLAEYTLHYQPNLQLANGIFGQLLANLLYLQNVLNQLYTFPIDNQHLPYQDLILLFVGCFCSADCYQDFWDLDDVLAQYFLPCWFILSK